MMQMVNFSAHKRKQKFVIDHFNNFFFEIYTLQIQLSKRIGFKRSIEMTMNFKKSTIQPLLLCNKKLFSTVESEKEKAQKAHENKDREKTTTIFDKIIDKSIKANIIYEDEHALAFHDVTPQAPVHFLVIPKVKGRLSMIQNSTEDDTEILGHLMYVCSKVSRELGIEKDGYRIIVNNGKNACQSVFHLHLHVLGGRQFNWPPG